MKRLRILGLTVLSTILLFGCSEKVVYVDVDVDEDGNEIERGNREIFMDRFYILEEKNTPWRKDPDYKILEDIETKCHYIYTYDGISPIFETATKVKGCEKE